MENPAQKPKETAGKSAGQIIGGIGGLALGWYAGLTLLLPLGLSFLFGWLLGQTLPSRKTWQTPAAIIAGHIGWMILGAALTARWLEVGIDIIFLLAGLIWLLIGPGLGPVIFLGIVHVLELAYDGYLLGTTDLTSPEYKAIVVHFVLYAAALALLITSYLQHRKAKPAVPAGIPASAGDAPPPL